MSQKPTYEELALRAKAFENEAFERKQDDEFLLREKDFSKSLIDSLPGIYYLFDEKGKFIRWNKNLESVSGYSAGEIMAQSCFSQRWIILMVVKAACHIQKIPDRDDGAVMGVIRASKKGVSVVQIMEQTGLKKGQIWPTISRAKRQGTVKIVKKGIYVKA